MITAAVISMFIYAYSIYCVLREITFISRSVLNEKQQKSHMSILMTIFMSLIMLLYLMFYPEGFIFGFEMFVIKYNAWLLFLVLSLSTTSVTRYFRKQRKGEDLQLDVKKEIKRTMTFGFSKRKEFEILAENFIKKIESEGGTVHYIDNASASVEPYKFMKKGETADFGKETHLEKISDKIEHNYKYYSKTPLVFGLHAHAHFKETLEAIDEPIHLYMIIKNKLVYEKLNVGDTYIIPKAIPHGVLMYKANTIGVKWT